MKTIKLTVLTGAIAMFCLISCQRDVNDFSAVNAASEETQTNASSPNANCNPFAYNVVLESRDFVNNNWEWTWSIQNPNPGNGNNGTAQDLSHWGIQLGTCFNAASLVSAAYSYDGVNWTSFTPSIGVDPSQGCITTPVLKFDAGTTGSARTYYRLVVNQFYAFGTANGYYKSGQRTGCCTFSFLGIGCGGDVEIESAPVE
jgi:hypothetical protein